MRARGGVPPVVGSTSALEVIVSGTQRFVAPVAVDDAGRDGTAGERVGEAVRRGDESCEARPGLEAAVAAIVDGAGRQRWPSSSIGERFAQKRVTVASSTGNATAPTPPRACRGERLSSVRPRLAEWARRGHTASLVSRCLIERLGSLDRMARTPWWRSSFRRLPARDQRTSRDQSRASATPISSGGSVRCAQITAASARSQWLG